MISESDNFDINSVEKRFNSAESSFHKAISSITPAASASMFENIKCEVYGSTHPISNFANISIVDNRTISIQVWDEAAVTPIYKCIQTSGVSSNPSIQGSTIRINLPPLTEERRKEMGGLIKRYSEDAKVSIRNIRRDENDKIRKNLKAKIISEDDAKKQETTLQKSTDKAVEKIESDSTKRINEILKF